MKTENIVALCDVDWKYAARPFKQFPEARQFRDFRKMLEEQKDIDAVVVATPDHMHAFASMAAIKLGKHVPRGRQALPQGRALPFGEVPV
jgi:predicted dehydrogenase